MNGSYVSIHGFVLHMDLRCRLLLYLSLSFERFLLPQKITTTELSKLLTSCLTAIKSHVIRYCETVYETSNKNWFWSIKSCGEVLSKLKCRGFRATSLSTYDFSTLYTTLPHYLIKEKLLDLIERTTSILDYKKIVWIIYTCPHILVTGLWTYI